MIARQNPLLLMTLDQMRKVTNMSLNPASMVRVEGACCGPVKPARRKR